MLSSSSKRLLCFLSTHLLSPTSMHVQRTHTNAQVEIQREGGEKRGAKMQVHFHSSEFEVGDGSDEAGRSLSTFRPYRDATIVSQPVFFAASSGTICVHRVSRVRPFLAFPPRHLNRLNLLHSLRCLLVFTFFFVCFVLLVWCL